MWILKKEGGRLSRRNVLAYTHGSEKETLLGNKRRCWETMYDPQIGRWHVVDPLASKFPWQTPYCAMDNDPVNKNDPTGMAASKPDDWYAIKNKDGSTSMYQDKGNTAASHYNTYTKETYTNVGGDNLTADQALANANTKLNETNWMTPSNRANFGLGSLATLLDTKGELNSLSMYEKGVRGGGVFSENYTLTGRNANLFKDAEMTSLTKPVSTVGKIGKFVGTGSFIAGTFMDGVGVMNYYENPNSPNAVHPAKAAVNTGFSIWGMGISKIGLRANPIVAIVYSGVDAFYPGGWLGDSKNPGALKVAADVQRRDREILGYYPKD